MIEGKAQCFMSKLFPKNLALKTGSNLEVIKPEVTENEEFQLEGKSKQKYSLKLSNCQHSNEKTKQKKSQRQ